MTVAMTSIASSLGNRSLSSLTRRRQQILTIDNFEYLLRHLRYRPDAVDLVIGSRFLVKTHQRRRFFLITLQPPKDHVLAVVGASGQRRSTAVANAFTVRSFAVNIVNFPATRTHQAALQSPRC